VGDTEGARQGALARAGWRREHLAFVLKLSVVGVRKLEHVGMAPVKSNVAREKLLELAKAIKEPNEVVKRLIEENEKYKLDFPFKKL
jgi:ribosome-binding protein aMBF1 (putative translation factor)